MRPFLIGAAGIVLGALAVVIVGITAGDRIPIWRETGRLASKPAVKGEPAPHGRAEGSDENAQANASRVTLSEAQIEAAGIVLARAEGGVLQHHFLVPGSIVSDSNRIARVAVRLLGTVAELRKGLGDPVGKGEIVAVIESREVADAKSEYLAARLTSDLQQTLAARLKTLLETRATSENDYLRARLTAQEAQIKLDSSRQKLFALGLTEAEITALPNEPVEALRKLALRSPIKGRVAERRVDLGGLVGREGQESELFVIVDLDRVWADLAVSPADVSKVRDGDEIEISAGADGRKAKARITFISPLLDRETRSARVIASVMNADHAWRPGSYITAEIPLGGAPAPVLIPKAAVQTVKSEPVVFVREGAAFEARKIKMGREDDDQVEILSGLAAGEMIAVANSFTLKAELAKSEAAHDD